MADYPNNKYTSTYTGTEIDEAVASAAKTKTDLASHMGNTSNPHNVTKAQLDLDKVENLSPADMPISTATQAALDVLTSGLAEANTDIEAVSSDLTAHKKADNPHNITKITVGLSNVDNTSDMAKPVSTLTQEALATKLDKSGDQTFDGNLTVTGNLTVSGTTITNDTETLTVQDNLIITNSTGANLSDLSGLAINIGSDTAYGIVYDPAQEAVRLGEGTVGADKEFTFNENEGKPIVVRDDTLNDVNDNYLTQWDNAQKAIVAAKSGALCGDLSIDGTATAFVSGQDQFALKTRFRTGESQFGAVYFGKEGGNSGSMIRIDQVEGTPRLYFRASETAGAIVWEQPEADSQVLFDVSKVNLRTTGYLFDTTAFAPATNNARNIGSSANRFKDLYLAGKINGQLTIPNKTGTLATTADIPEAPVTSVNNKTGAVELTKADIGLGSVDNVKQYSASNPPPYPVTSVAGRTGAITLTKNDVGLGNVDNIADANQVKHGQQTLDSASLSSNNLNNVTQPGWYVMASSNSVANKPTGVAGFSLEVLLCTDNKIIQKLYDDFTNIYIRIRTASTTWSNWAQLSTSNTNIPYVEEISSSDWTGSTRPYKVTITGSTHGKGTMPSVTVFEQLNGTYVQVGADPTIDMTTGNVTIESNAKLALRVLID